MPDLKHELQQRRPFTSPAEEAFLNLLRSAAVLGQTHARFLRPWRLTPPQFNALRILRGAHPGALTCSEVGERMVAPVPDVTRLLDRLERKGLLRRGRDERDRRVVNTRITGPGLALLAEVDAPLAGWLETTLAPLGEAGQRRLIALLEKARAG